MFKKGDKVTLIQVIRHAHGTNSEMKTAIANKTVCEIARIDEPDYSRNHTHFKVTIPGESWPITVHENEIKLVEGENKMFKTNDKVKAIRNEVGYYKIGDTYTVTKDQASEMFTCIDSSGDSHYFTAQNFALVTDIPKAGDKVVAIKDSPRGKYAVGQIYTVVKWDHDYDSFTIEESSKLKPLRENFKKIEAPAAPVSDFKAGDEVILVPITRGHAYGSTESMRRAMANKTVCKVVSVGSASVYIKIPDSDSVTVTRAEIQLFVPAFSKADLKTGMVAITRNGYVFVVFADVNELITNDGRSISHMGLANYANDLSYSGSDKSWDIVDVKKAGTFVYTIQDLVKTDSLKNRAKTMTSVWTLESKEKVQLQGVITKLQSELKAAQDKLNTIK